jgi:hypothetical protein
VKVVVTQRAIVQPGGLIQVRDAKLEERLGEQADVIVSITSGVDSPLGNGGPAHPTLSSFIGAGCGAFATQTEIDGHIRAERDAWDH